MTNEDMPCAIYVLIAVAFSYFIALLLGGCAATHEEQAQLEPPPLYVHLCDAMPAADQELWGTWAGDINAGHAYPPLWIGHGPPAGCNTVDLCPGEPAFQVRGCRVVVRYDVPDRALFELVLAATEED